MTSAHTGMCAGRLARALALAATIATAIFWGLSLGPAPARAEPATSGDAPAVPQVAGGDIFGFTSSSDIGSPGDHGGALEMDGAFGKRDGRYHVLTQKLAYERVIAENWSLGFAFFTTYHNLRNVTVAPINRTSAQFDGLNFEIAHRLVERSAGNPFSFKIAFEPRWSRLDDGGRHSESFGVELKFITDAVVIPDKLYWAGNLVLASGTSRDPDLAKYAPSSEIKLSNALAMQMSKDLLIGVEATYIATFDGGAFNHHTGHAIFLGPTLFWKVSEKIALNATIAPQIAGRALASPGLRYDLDNFTRMMSRVKLAVEF